MVGVVFGLLKRNEIVLKTNYTFQKKNLTKPFYNFFKRSFDIIFAIIGLILFSPVLIVVSVLVKISSPGPVFYRGVRTGRFGQQFRIFKFRSMFLGSDLKALTTSRNDPRVTRVGKIIRRYKIDELPQLINVLLGHMSFVGPRPCLPSQIEVIKEREKQGITDIRPGITGPAQIGNIDMSDPVRLAIKDLEWTSDRSLKSYFYLIILTGLGKGRGDNVD